jgi:hypothetical protein
VSQLIKLSRKSKLSLSAKMLGAIRNLKGVLPIAAGELPLKNSKK